MTACTLPKTRTADGSLTGFGGALFPEQAQQATVAQTTAAVFMPGVSLQYSCERNNIIACATFLLPIATLAENAIHRYERTVRLRIAPIGAGLLSFAFLLACEGSEHTSEPAKDGGAGADGALGSRGSAGSAGGGASGRGGSGGRAGAAGTGGSAAGTDGSGGSAGASGSAGTNGSGGSTAGTGGTATGGTGGSVSYSTEFDGDEDPLSENGAWSHVGLDWQHVRKAGGIAFGTQTGTGGYDDSFAIMKGFPADHAAQAKIHLIANIDGSCTHEVEILLRWKDADHSARGYECNVNFDGGYQQIVRWNGAFGDFTVLGGGSVPGLKDGDVFKATISGNVITTYVNDVQIARLSDSTFGDGNPGVGFFRRDCGANTDFAFTNFAAWSLP